MRPTDAEIKRREAIEHPYEPEKPLMEAWRCDYVKDAYEDQLGLKHNAWVVLERAVIKVVARAEQFEYYAEKWYMSDWIGYDETGRKFRFYANLVDYSGGGSWSVVGRGNTGRAAVLNTNESTPPKREPGFWKRPPWIDPELGYARGYMLPDGSKATALLTKDSSI